MDSDNDILSIKGIGSKTASLLNKLHIFTPEDLVHYYPRDYICYGEPVMLHQIQQNEQVALYLKLTDTFKWKALHNGRMKNIGSGHATDGQDQITISFYNSIFLKSKLVEGNSYLFWGVVQIKKGNYHMIQPKIYEMEEYRLLQQSLQPVYALTSGITNHLVRKSVKQALSMYQNEEYLSPSILSAFHLCSEKEALIKLHFPDTTEDMVSGRRRLAFDELLAFLYQIRSQKAKQHNELSAFSMLETASPLRLMEALPYKLTSAQNRVFQDIKQDMISGICMNRLIQGDVGSGKTILAVLALLLAIDNGYQGAFMAPTEILAVQHYELLLALTQKYHLPFQPVLLTGSIKTKEKEQIYNKISDGICNLVVGTHALIQEKVHFKNLAIVITDEQHRFGVHQRETLGNKGNMPHILVMSATPIPRTLAIILYGDLQISILDELPKNRKPIKNCVVDTSYRPKAYSFIQNEVRKGRQAYVICPMVEASEEDHEIENVTEYTAQLKAAFPESMRVFCLHGRMKPEQKQHIMNEFMDGNIDVLVSTTVIEVGIDVPNASVMMIENAERFGLAQLHQLRGRIGRGTEQSYCIFVNGSKKKENSERLEIMNHSNDGFHIAEEDLKMRGPGDLFGLRQSGQLAFHIADIYQDADMIKKISMLLDQIFRDDPEFTLPENHQLQQYFAAHRGNFIDFRTI